MRGGRDRDRTCDPYHVNEEVGTEMREFRVFVLGRSADSGTMLRECSAFPVRRTKDHYVACLPRGGRDHLGMAGGIIPERWAASPRMAPMPFHLGRRLCLPSR